MEIKLSPSILSADFANLARDIKIATDAGAEYVHVDVMDGHFVPNITIGAPVVKSLRKATDKVLDVHLMISDPDQYLDDFIKAGSDIITVHYESNGDTLEQLKKIRAAGVKAACVIKPKTPVEVLFPGFQTSSTSSASHSRKSPVTASISNSYSRPSRMASPL